MLLTLPNHERVFKSTHLDYYCVCHLKSRRWRHRVTTKNGERSFESATSVTVRGQWRRAHLVSIDKSRRGRASKPQCDVTLSTRAAPCCGPALRKRAGGRYATRSARPLCAPQARTVHTRQRATGARTLPACLPCVVVTTQGKRAHCPLACPASEHALPSTAVQPSSAAHCGIGRRDTRVQARRLRTPVRTACSIVITGLPLTALLPPDSTAAAPRVPKNKNSEVARRHPDGLGTEHNTQSFSGC